MVNILILDKVNFKTKSFIRDKNMNYLVIKRCEL